MITMLEHGTWGHLNNLSLCSPGHNCSQNKLQNKPSLAPAEVRAVFLILTGNSEDNGLEPRFRSHH